MVEYMDHIPTPEELQAKGVINLGPFLPLSPCVKSKANGRVFPWHASFARRSEAYVNCDESGNTDPRTWSGRGPDGLESGSEPPAKPMLDKPPLQPYFDNVLDGRAVATGAVPQKNPEIDPGLLPPILG